MNLFEISNDFRMLLDNIEECDGEITPEIEEALTITEENGRKKIDDYVKAIKAVESDIEACKLEKKRIVEVQERKQRLLDKLKTVVVNYVSEFGNTTKSGGRYIDCPTYKVSVRNSDSCEIDNEFINKCNVCVTSMIERLAYNNMLGRDLDYKGLVYNTIKEELGYEISDEVFKLIKVSVNFEVDGDELFNENNENLLRAYYQADADAVDFNLSSYKTDCKNAIKSGTFVPFATLSVNKSLNIK